MISKDDEGFQPDEFKDRHTDAYFTSRLFQSYSRTRFTMFRWEDAPVTRDKITRFTTRSLLARETDAGVDNN